MRTVTLCLGLVASVAVWGADSQSFIAPDWIEQHRSDAEVVLLDARPEAEYSKGHIPGAISINASDKMIDTSAQGERAFHDWLTEIFSRAGLRPKDKIVVYDSKLGPRAARAYWMLCYAGQQTVYMLQGGFEGWKEKQLPIATEPSPARAATKYRLKPQKKYLASAQEVLAGMKDRKVVVLDVRSQGEYEGKAPADAPRKGHIPGALWVEWKEFLTADGSAVLEPEKLGVMLSQKGITPDKQIVTYCQSGARAAMVWAVLDDLSYPKVKNYVGSWNEWAAKKELPVE